MDSDRFDLVLRNATAINAADSFEADIGVKNGRIAAIGKGLGPALRELDASKHWVLPGGIEAHCHIEQESSGGIMTADDYYSGSVSAAFGGNTCFIPFAAQHRGQSIAGVLERYHARAEPKSVIDYSFHLIVSDPTEEVLRKGLPAAFEQGITSFKVYMTYESLIVDDSQMLDILSVAKRHGALTMVHAENHAMIRWMSRKLTAAGFDAPRYHAVSHPRAAEAEAIHRAIELANFLDAPVLIVHVSTAAGAKRIAEARLQGHKVFGETCPQYMFLEAKDMDLPGLQGAKYCCSPPRRDREECKPIWLALQNGTFELYSSDHAPYRFDKSGKLHQGPRPPFTQLANGVPGIELRLPLLFSEGVNKGRISPHQFVALACANAARIYGLAHRKGSTTEGKDADLVLWDPQLRRTVTHTDLHDRVDYTPYEGMELTGWPTTVIRRGELIVHEGALCAERGSGHFIARTPLDTTGMPGVLAEELDPRRNFGAQIA